MKREQVLYWSLVYVFFFVAFWIKIVKCVTTLWQSKRSDLEWEAVGPKRGEVTVFPYQITGILKMAQS